MELGQSWALSQVWVARGPTRVSVDTLPHIGRRPATMGVGRVQGPEAHLGSDACVSSYHRAGCACLWLSF